MRDISVIIPALDEADRIGDCLATLAGAEVIVADGGSTDGTVEIARAHGASVVASTGPRGAALNAAAGAASGDILLFLHADTHLPAGWTTGVRDSMQDHGISLGAFSLAIRNARRAERLLCWGANMRSRVFSLPYGDQALFLRAEMFRRLGGFRAVPIMEDFDLVRRARALGRVVTRPEHAVTSPRRWRKKGAVKTTAINQAMLLGWQMGISPERLSAFYRGRRL
ncbi:TIGR04283 family arsenosugar biosynthesis glycosyltransferase [Pacificimonas sp. WHA3]|uniref:TIGR04283 family arsenosugar biosynthesis glycosyltransferase n=1 Tax=Pacificimonas pallii TaxID=2827236 RepID=A0ABS6SH32_9SPHN|nr:TIGR04283 family arsenosugar biosynthesis glycosyltransferase [Pacificimonas pallii]